MILIDNSSPGLSLDTCSLAVAFISVQILTSAINQAFSILCGQSRLSRIVLNMYESLFICYPYYLDGQAVPKNLTNSQDNILTESFSYITVTGQLAGNIIEKRSS